MGYSPSEVYPFEREVLIKAFLIKIWKFSFISSESYFNFIITLRNQYMP
jgi:hypothetical protein